MARAKVKWNSAAAQEYLNGEHGVAAVLEAKASRVASAAQSSAPVESGAYRNSIHVATEHTDRMVKRVLADVPYAFAVEARAGILAKALDAAGGS